MIVFKDILIILYINVYELKCLTDKINVIQNNEYVKSIDSLHTRVYISLIL